ncbi:MAG TPA: hypothetical protein VNT27_12040 [Propionibacteriaceae bacterium]|nr:hypothetical protein [Propionibacteriaceae bacterium]
MAAPAGFDAAAARPRVVLHYHLAEAALRSGHAVVRAEDGGPLTLHQLTEFLGRSGCQVQIQPVLDPTETAPWTAMRYRRGCELRSECVRSPTSSPSAAA